MASTLNKASLACCFARVAGLLPAFAAAEGLRLRSMALSSPARPAASLLQTPAGFFDIFDEADSNRPQGWDLRGDKTEMPATPDTDSLLHYEERSVNTTIKCKDAGCVAHSMLQAFDGTREKGKNCKLNLHLHPTDFDDQYSGERLTFIKVNGVTVSTDCFPMVSGCNATTQKPMFTCVRDLVLDNIISENGFLNISTQIADTVDECPYEGNLLSGVPVVTCMVASRSDNLTQQSPPGAGTPSLPVMPGTPEGVPYIYVSAPLRCPERGCTAVAPLKLTPLSTPIEECLMDVTLYQTDFDGEEGTKEMVEYVKLDDDTLKQNFTPGNNPCRQMWRDGTKLSLAQTQYSVLKGLNVTEKALRGELTVTAKITEYVDECAHDGYLLNGFVEVNCSTGAPNPIG